MDKERVALSRSRLPSAQLCVVKVGSSLITSNASALDVALIEQWVRQIADLKKQGKRCIVVSSGAVAAGMWRMRKTQRPKKLAHLQALASIGQIGLSRVWESAFDRYNIKSSLTLLTYGDLSSRDSYLNIRSTIRTLLDYQVVPIINENDAVSADEIKFGDNDTLAALVANLISADLLLLLTDQKGLHQADPNIVADAPLISSIDLNDKSLEKYAQPAQSNIGRGGMATKLRAARLAARSGTATVIAHGREDNIINQALSGESVGTFFTSTDAQLPVVARKRWIYGQLLVKGSLMLDQGAVAVLLRKGSSLLPIGVISSEGEYERGEAVRCCDSDGKEIARGLINYSATEVEKIMGQKSSEIAELLGYCGEDELIHRDNLVLSS